MLQEIYINNFVLIDELKISFTKGLNVITGETGAGKSIIIDAIGLLMGERIKGDYIRDESKKAIIDAQFDISNYPNIKKSLFELGLLEEDNNVLITREIYPNGKNIARINNRQVTIKVLKDLTLNMVDMHLQHDNLRVLNPEKYLELVDSFSDTKEYLEKIEDVYKTLQSKKEELEILANNERERLQKLDYLNYQIDEIEKANIVLGEDEELLKLKERIINSTKLLEGSQRLMGFLYNGDNNSAYDLISKSIDICNENSKEDFLNDISIELQNIFYNIEDIAKRISLFINTLDHESNNIDEIEDRIYQLNRLKNKYGSTLEEVLLFFDKSKNEKEILNNSKEIQSNLQNEIVELKSHYEKISIILTELRTQAAVELEKRVFNELVELNMPYTQFNVNLTVKEPSVKGVDKIEFLFSANPGEELQPISKVASGGEISRIILAIKKAAAEFYDVPILIFDEIDVGLGGETLNIIARKLAEFSKTHQILLVTHTPQVASYADNHLLVEKIIEQDKTTTVVTKLNEKDKIKEITRMLGGEKLTEVTYKHAEELITKANNFKNLS